MRGTLCALLASASLLAHSSTANAQENVAADLAKTVLTEVVTGFSRSAGEDLWGWIMGGSGSGDTAAIASGLNEIETTLTQIESELVNLNAELQQLDCDIQVDSLSTPAGVINGFYNQCQTWVEDMCEADASGTCQNTGEPPSVDVVEDWAQCVVGEAQGCQNDNVLTALDEINTVATGGAAPADRSSPACRRRL